MKPPDPAAAEWGRHLDWMEGVPPPAPVAAPRLLPGLLFAAALAAGAWGIARLGAGRAGAGLLDPVMLAMLLGLVAGNLGLPLAACRPGAAWALRRLLPLGIVLLGARLDFFAVLRVGAAGLALSVLFVAAALLLFGLFVRLGWLPRREGWLLGIGTAICGGTAIVALAPLIRAKEQEIAVGVATVTLVGLAAMLALPLAASALALDAAGFGLWAGLAIHQTPQVVAAGFAHSPAAGEIATIVKLARVCLLAPVVVLLGLLWTRTGGEGVTRARPWWRMLPLFVPGFLGFALLRTLGLLPDFSLRWDALGSGGTRLEFSSATLAATLAGACLAVAMAGVGLESSVAAFRRAGLRAVGAAGLAAALLALLALGAILLIT